MLPVPLIGYFCGKVQERANEFVACEYCKLPKLQYEAVPYATENGIQQNTPSGGLGFQVSRLLSKVRYLSAARVWVSNGFLTVRLRQCMFKNGRRWKPTLRLNKAEDLVLNIKHHPSPLPPNIKRGLKRIWVRRKES